MHVLRGRPALAVMAAAIAVAAAVMGSAPAEAAEPQRPLIAEGCVGCHGVGAAGQGGVPGIRGYDRAEFVKAWAAFRANERPATIMNRIARGYTDDEVAALAAYFSSLK